MSSIFGDTYGGVPSPRIFHEHPYPTRYHGMNLTVPRFGLPFVETPYAVPPYSGLGGGCGCAGTSRAGGTQADLAALGGLGASFGAVGFAAGAVYGGVVGAVAGALIGHFGMHKAGKGAAWGAGIGALALGALYGTVGAAGGAAVESVAQMGEQ